MAADDADRHFLLWRQTGDPRALAGVFDRLAPELLLVAAHLTGGSRRSGFEPEDLLQATFLAAIESAARFDAGQALRPWLIGILANLVRRERRREQRAEAHGTWHDRVQDPVEETEAAEFAEHFSRSLESLAPPYRTVLTLRLVHGLKAIEIAHALGHPPATVRTHLRRGLLLLRGMLPAGFAGSALLAFGGGRSLAAVRAAVLERAVPPAAPEPAAPEPAAPEPAAPGPHPGGGTQTLAPASASGPRSLAFLGVAGGATLAVALAIAALATGGWSDASRGPALAGPEASDRPASAPDASTPAARTPADAPRPATVAETASARIRVRWGDDGTPAGGVQVGLVFPQLPDPALHQRWVVTDAEGIAVAEGLPASVCELSLDRGGGPTRASLGPGATHTVDLEVPPGVTVLGKVVGPEEEPVSGAAVWLSAGSAPDQGLLVDRTDAAGRFRLRAVAAGQYVAATADGFLPACLRPVAAQPGATVRIKLRLEPGGLEILGRVLDAERRPVANARVLLGNNLPAMDSPPLAHVNAARRPPVWLVTDAAGAFRTTNAWTIFPTCINVFARAPGFATWARCAPLPTAGPLRFDIVLRRGATLQGVVRDGDGQPVAGALLWIADDQIAPVGLRPQSPPWAFSSARSGADGRYRLPHVRGRTVRLRAEDDAGRHAVAELEADDDQTHVWDPVLLSPGRISGRLTDPDGVPLCGWRVGARAPPSGAPDLVVATDELGGFTLSPCDGAPYAVYVFEPGSVWDQPAVALSGVEPGRAPLSVVVPHARRATARLRGRIVDADGRPAAIGLGVDGDSFGGAIGRTDPETGAFEVGPVPPGTLRLRHYDGLGIRATLGVATVAPGTDHDFGTLTLERPGSVRLAVRGAGASPVSDGNAQLTAEDGTVYSTWPLAAGDTTSTPVGPGLYFLRVQDPEGQTLAWTTVQVRSGEATAVELLVPEGAPCRLQLVPPPHVDAAMIVVEWRDDADRLLARERVAWSSRARPAAMRLPLGAWRVCARDEDGRQAQARIEITDLTQPQRTIRLALQ